MIRQLTVDDDGFLRLCEQFLAQRLSISRMSSTESTFSGPVLSLYRTTRANLRATAQNRLARLLAPLIEGQWGQEKLRALHVHGVAEAVKVVGANQAGVNDVLEEHSWLFLT